jgi:hypothetical protein
MAVLVTGMLVLSVQAAKNGLAPIPDPNDEQTVLAQASATDNGSLVVDRLDTWAETKGKGKISPAKGGNKNGDPPPPKMSVARGGSENSRSRAAIGTISGIPRVVVVSGPSTSTGSGIPGGPSAGALSGLPGEKDSARSATSDGGTVLTPASDAPTLGIANYAGLAKFLLEIMAPHVQAKFAVNAK